MWTSDSAYGCCSAGAIDGKSASARGFRRRVWFRVWRALLGWGVRATGSSAAATRNAANFYGTFTPGICIFGDCKLGASLVARLAKVQRYPAQARGVQGAVNLAFTIDRHGGVVSGWIVKSSGSTGPQIKAARKPSSCSRFIGCLLSKRPKNPVEAFEFGIGQWL